MICAGQIRQDPQLRLYHTIGQVHVSHAALSHMLVNSESLKGMAPRVRALAAREAAVSAVVPPHAVSALWTVASID